MIEEFAEWVVEVFGIRENIMGMRRLLDEIYMSDPPTRPQIIQHSPRCFLSAHLPLKRPRKNQAQESIILKSGMATPNSATPPGAQASASGIHFRQASTR